jgi:hypothetical protein
LVGLPWARRLLRRHQATEVTIQDERDHLGHRSTGVTFDRQIALQLDRTLGIEQLEAHEISGISGRGVADGVARPPALAPFDYERAEATGNDLARRFELGAQRVGRSGL